MEKIFDSKFKKIITSKDNRNKTFDFLTKYIEDNTSNHLSSREKDDLMYCLFYELYFEYNVNPNKEHLYNILKKNIVYT